MEDDTYEQYLYRVSLGDIDAYELTDLQAKEEQVQEDVGQDSIAISENEFDEKDMLVDLWEDSISVMYPTEFPEKVLHKTNHHGGEPSNRRFTQTIFLEPESYGDAKVGFTVYEQDGDRTCTFFDDLDVVDTIDGDEYLFYDYKNKDVEAAVAIDGYCYYFDAEEKTEEEMLAIAQSLEPIDSVFHEISVDDLKFPTKFTIEEPEVRDPRVISYTDGEKVDFLIDYRGDLDKDIKMDFEIRNNEPSGYMSESSGQEVEVDGWEEAYFNESSTRLFLYDGDYYYIVKFDLSTDQQEAFGMDHIIETAIEIGESIQ